MSYDDLDRTEITTRLRAILKALSCVEDPNEEERLLNEQLYLRGVLAGLKADTLRKCGREQTRTRRAS